LAKLEFDAELIEVPPTAELEDPCILRAGVGEGARTF
jgi:hypothetical protein